MKKKVLAATAVLMLFAMSLFAMPSAKADVYIPPGPGHDKAAWISPTLFVFDMQDEKEIGWVYSDGGMWVATSSLNPIPTALNEFHPGQTKLNKIHKSNPMVPWGIERTVIPFSSYVMVFGFIPGVVVAPDQNPPPVEIVITWNGVPYVVTLTREEDVGLHYPPPVLDDKTVPYAFTYPYEDPDGTPNAPWKDASYNIWVGDPNHIEYIPYDMPFGYYFWYIFHPNVGDWIAWNCDGETKHPPTYDITALFEYETSQIWFNHVCFDVRFLEAHRMVDWASLPWPWANEIVDELLITNHGKVEATELDVWINLPADRKVYVDPVWHTTSIRIFGDREIGPIPMPDDFVFGKEYKLPSDYLGYDLSILYPGETMIISMEHNLVNTIGWIGTLVFDSMVSAWEIPPWKYPRAMHSLAVGGPEGDIEFLWIGWHLGEVREGYSEFKLIEKWPIVLPKLRCPLPPQGTPDMDLDPEPVDLTGDGKIDGQDITLVRQAIIGLIPYDVNMDINANGKIDTYDLASYKLAAD